jgi:hypothetical protein
MASSKNALIATIILNLRNNNIKEDDEVAFYLVMIYDVTKIISVLQVN